MRRMFEDEAMRMMLTGLALTVAVPAGATIAVPAGATIAVPAGAQTAAPACATGPALPPELAGWAKPVAIRDGATLPIGTAGDVALNPAATFAPAPAKVPAAGTSGASIGFTVATAGTYRVALGAPVWVDVVRDGTALASIGHGHGEPCSPVRKMVDFALTPGRYTVQLSGARTPRATMLIARLP